MYYSVGIFIVTTNNKMLQTIIQTFSQNGGQILLTTLLVLIVIYFYSFFGFNFIIEDFYHNREVPENICFTPFYCFISIFSFSPRLSGGIGDIMKPPSYLTFSKYILRFFYDLSQFIVINIILINYLIVVVDAFAKQRDRQS